MFRVFLPFFSTENKLSYFVLSFHSFPLHNFFLLSCTHAKFKTSEGKVIFLSGSFIFHFSLLLFAFFKEAQKNRKKQQLEEEKKLSKTQNAISKLKTSQKLKKNACNENVEMQSLYQLFHHER
jgi:hypothetical protein